MTKTGKTETKAQGTTAPAASKSGNEIDRLGTMKIGELQALYAEVVGKPTKCPTRAWLVRSIMEAAVPADTAASTEPEEPATETAATDAALAATPATQAISEAVPSGALEEAPTDPDQNTAPEPAAVSELAGPEAIVDDTKLSQLDVPALQARYIEAFGRATSSGSRNYLLYRLREAQKGRAPRSPRQRHQKAGDDVMVLPLRMEADLVDKLDEAWRRQGLRNRMDLFRRSLQSYLASVGENDVAALLATEA